MKKIIFFFSVATIGCLCFSNCDNPKKQGEKLGQEYCNCQKEYAKKQEKSYTDFLSQFDSYGFKTRTEARQKWQGLKDEATQKFEECKAKVEDKKKKVESEFPTDVSNLLDPKIMQNYLKNPQKYLNEFTKNQKKADEFNDALRSAANNCDAKGAQVDESKIQEKILQISPGKPDTVLLKQNLVNRRINEQEGGYFGSSHAKEFHLYVLTEPYVKVSLHTALHVRKNHVKLIINFAYLINFSRMHQSPMFKQSRIFLVSGAKIA